MNPVIIRYNAGNVQSVQNALGRLGVAAAVSDDPSVIRAASHVIFPGVGEASSAMNHLRERGLDAAIRGLRQPVLGICLGLQLLCEVSEEGDASCLGIFPLGVRRFTGKIKIPHMGWNTLSKLSGPLFDGVPEETAVYFVHGYRAEVGEGTSAVCSYGGDFSAALSKDNFHAVQFHPEKSGAAGARMLDNFLRL